MSIISIYLTFPNEMLASINDIPSTVGSARPLFRNSRDQAIRCKLHASRIIIIMLLNHWFRIRTVYLLDDKRISQSVEKALKICKLHVHDIVYIKTDIRHQFLSSIISYSLSQSNSHQSSRCWKWLQRRMRCSKSTIFKEHAVQNTFWEYTWHMLHWLQSLLSHQLAPTWL